MKKETKKPIKDKSYFEMALEFEKEKHKLKMIELKYTRESDEHHHERELERQRIKSASIRKVQEGNLMKEKYWK